MFLLRSHGLFLWIQSHPKEFDTDFVVVEHFRWPLFENKGRHALQKTKPTKSTSQAHDNGQQVIEPSHILLLGLLKLTHWAILAHSHVDLLKNPEKKTRNSQKPPFKQGIQTVRKNIKYSFFKNTFLLQLRCRLEDPQGSHNSHELDDLSMSSVGQASVGGTGGWYE